MVQATFVLPNTILFHHCASVLYFAAHFTMLLILPWCSTWIKPKKNHKLASGNFYDLICLKEMLFRVYITRYNDNDIGS